MRLYEKVMLYRYNYGRYNFLSQYTRNCDLSVLGSIVIYLFSSSSISNTYMYLINIIVFLFNLTFRLNTIFVNFGNVQIIISCIIIVSYRWMIYKTIPYKCWEIEIINTKQYS